MSTFPMTSYGENYTESPSTSRGAELQHRIEDNFDTSSPIEIQEFVKEATNVGYGRAKVKVPNTNSNKCDPPETEELIFKPQTARDRERLDAGKQALRELLKERKIEKKKKTSFFSLIRLYITFISALLISGGLMILIFLVPMTIDPALATINYDIDENPAICLTISAYTAIGPGSTSWCSCRNGCTKNVYRCQQVTVAYRKGFMQLPEALQNGFNKTAFLLSGGHLPHDKNIVDEDIDVDRMTLQNDKDCMRKDWVFNEKCWDSLNSSLQVNVKACGYPPYVNCPIFLQSYNKTGRRFLCYYSKLDPSIAIINYNPNQPWKDLAQSLGWTCGAQFLGSFLIFVLHYPFRKNWKSFINFIRQRKKKKTVTTNPTKFKNKVRQPIFQRDWYDVHT